MRKIQLLHLMIRFGASPKLGRHVECVRMLSFTCWFAMVPVKKYLASMGKNQNLCVKISGNCFFHELEIVVKNNHLVH